MDHPVEASNVLPSHKRRLTKRSLRRCHLPILLSLFVVDGLSFSECHHAWPRASVSWREKLSRSECWRSIYPLHLFLPGSNRSFFFAPPNIAQKERGEEEAPSHRTIRLVWAVVGTGSCGQVVDCSEWAQEREDGQPHKLSLSEEKVAELPWHVIF